MTPPTRRHATDTYYLETCDCLAALGIDSEMFSHRHAVLLLKPDAAVTAAMRPAVEWLIANGYRIVGAYPVNLTRLHVRALWYFNWHRATRDRRRLADGLAGMSPSVVLVVTHPDDSRPVSLRLTADKGPADPTLREPGQLRFALSAGTYLLNLVHSADDPDDVLRELAVYFGEPQLTEVLSACAAGADAATEARRVVDLVEAGVPHRSGDVEVAQAEIWAELSASGVTERPRTADEWVSAIDTASRHGVALDPWYRTVIESACLRMHRR